MPFAPSLHRSTTTVPWTLFAISLVSVALHLWLGFASAHGTWMTVFMVAIAAACLPCTVNLLRSCSPKGLLTMMGLAAVSAVVHGAILLSGLIGSGSAGGHGAHGHATAHVGAASGHGVQLVVLLVVELGVLILAHDRYSRRTDRESASAPSTAPVGTSQHHTPGPSRPAPS